MTDQIIDGFRCIETLAGRTAIADGKPPFHDHGAVSLVESGELVAQVQGRHVVIPPAVVRWLLDKTDAPGGED